MAIILFGEQMVSRARKYTVTLAKLVACLVIAGVLLLPFESEISCALLGLVLCPVLLTAPVSLVWMIVAIVKNEWRCAALMGCSLILALVAFLAFGILNWRVLHTG